MSSTRVLGTFDKCLTGILEKHWENLLVSPRTDKGNYCEIWELFWNREGKI